MKTITYFFLTVLIIFSNIGCAHAQTSIEDKQAMQMLKEFYIAHNIAWSVARTTGPYVLIKKLDSLQKKYCSVRMRKELKEEQKKNGLDYDLLTNDEHADVKHLKTLTITKDATKTNGYTVSYIASNTDPTGKPIDEKAVIHVTVVKENEGLKIASVK